MSTSRILRTPNDLTPAEIRTLYAKFNNPISEIDCGQKCAPHNPSGKPFCCDICEAVPAAYKSEWATVQLASDLWHPYRGDECSEQPLDEDEMPGSMIPLACLGPHACERENRLISCRQFPFIPYLTADYEFLGITYAPAFEEKCWVISHLDQVSDAYQEEFIHTFDEIFALFQDEFESYAIQSEELRDARAKKHRDIPVILRTGGLVSVNPLNEQITPLSITPKFGIYL